MATFSIGINLSFAENYKMNRTTLFLLIAVVLFCQNSIAQVSAVPPTSKTGPLRFYVSAGLAYSPVNALNDLLLANKYPEAGSTTVMIGGGIQRRLFHKLIFQSDLYTGLLGNRSTTSIRQIGWHTTLGYGIRLGRQPRLTPFIGYSINTLNIMASKLPDPQTNLTGYFANPPDQINLRGGRGLGQVGIQLDIMDVKNLERVSIRTGYGFGNISEWHQRGTGADVPGSLKINPVGAYLKLIFYIR